MSSTALEFNYSPFAYHFLYTIVRDFDISLVDANVLLHLRVRLCDAIEYNIPLQPNARNSCLGIQFFNAGGDEVPKRRERERKREDLKIWLFKRSQEFTL